MVLICASSWASCWAEPECVQASPRIKMAEAILRLERLMRYRVTHSIEASMCFAERPKPGWVQPLYSRAAHNDSTSEMLVQERGDLSEGLFGLWHAIIELVLGVRHSFEDFELGVYAGFAKLAVHAHRIAQQQIASSGGEDGGRKAMHVSINGGKQGIAEVVTVGVDHCGRVAESVA